MKFIFQRQISLDNRIVVPPDIKALCGMRCGDSIAVTLLPDADGFSVKKLAHQCQICNAKSDLFYYKHLCLCGNCMAEFTKGVDTE